MPRGPNGEHRPADLVGRAVKIAKIATGEIEEAGYKQPNKVRSGMAGAKARYENLTRNQRIKIAKKAASARWGVKNQ